MVLTYLGVNEVYLRHEDRANFMKCLHDEVCHKLKVEYTKMNRAIVFYTK